MSALEERVQVLEEIEAIRRLKLRYARHCDDNYNADKLAPLFTEDAVWDNVPMSPAKGKAAIREMTNGFMKDATAFTAKILKSAHDGNVIFNERVDTIVMKNGKKADIPVAGMFELTDGGKIKVWRDYFDLGTFTKQIS